MEWLPFGSRQAGAASILAKYEESRELQVGCKEVAEYEGERKNFIYPLDKTH